MTRHDRIDPPPGRSLVRAEDSGLSLVQRIAQALGLSRRSSIRLLAVPRDPVAGDKARGAAMLEGRLRCGARDHAIAGLGPTTPGLPPEAVERLHSFAWLRDLGAAAMHEQGHEVAEELTRAWLAALPDETRGLAWRPDLVGRRILFWTAYAPYILAARDAAYRSRLLRHLVRGARHIGRSADKAPPGLRRIAAWSGAVGAALVVQGPASRLTRAEAGLARAVRTGMSEDGGLVSRAPFEQLELVELLGMLRACYATTVHGLPDWLQEAQEGALSALKTVLLGDQALSSWQSGNPSSPRRIAAAVEGLAMQAAPLRQASGWGYQRLEAKGSVALLDAAPPPAGRHIPGASPSTLAFEFSHGEQRLVVNCGGAGADRSALPEDFARLLRATAAHSTLTLGHFNSTAVLPAGGLGRGVSEVDLDRGTRDGFLMAEASHDGYVRRFGLAHRRQLLLAPDGGTLAGQDVLLAQGKPRKKNAAFTLRFHLAPGVEVISTADGRGAVLRIGRAKPWQFKCRGGALAIEESVWIDGEARPHGTAQLVVSGESPPDGMTVSWEFKRAG